MQYKSETPRIMVKLINSGTENVICEINDRNWMNVGELFSSHVMSGIALTELKKGKTLPKKIMVIAIAEYDLVLD